MVAIIAPLAGLSLAQAAWAGPDRYGPAMRDDEAASVPSAPQMFLNWPGKAQPAQTPAASPLADERNARAAPDTPPAFMRAAPPAASPTSIYAPPPPRAAQARLPSPSQTEAAAFAARPLRPAEPVPRTRPSPATAQIAVAKPRAQPTAAPPRSAQARPVASPDAAPVAAQPPSPTTAANPQPAAIAANGAPPHFYSVHRQFGVAPDPIPLAPQFFADGATADLAGPPPPPAPHLIPGQSASSAVNQQRAANAAAAAEDPNTSN